MTRCTHRIDPQRYKALLTVVRLTRAPGSLLSAPMIRLAVTWSSGARARRGVHEQPRRSHLRSRHGAAGADRGRRRVAVARLRVAHLPARAARPRAAARAAMYPEGNNGLCTAECESDDDCDRVPESPCKTGFTCGVAVTVGPFCCKKFCICKDYIVIPDSRLARRRRWRATPSDAGERVLQPVRPRRATRSTRSARASRPVYGRRGSRKAAVFLFSALRRQSVRLERSNADADVR